VVRRAGQQPRRIGEVEIVSIILGRIGRADVIFDRERTWDPAVFGFCCIFLDYKLHLTVAFCFYESDSAAAF
jgi:hypothetical protein